jgi:membrane protein implicated in regulation of membrane protease activity
VATAAILLGHAVSIWWSHRVVLAAGVPRRRAAVALVPLTLLMVAFTALSLVLLSAPET